MGGGKPPFSSNLRGPPGPSLVHWNVGRVSLSKTFCGVNCVKWVFCRIVVFRLSSQTVAITGFLQRARTTTGLWSARISQLCTV